jgi:hypothetical protein
MPSHPPDSEPLEAALESTRRNVRQLEIQTHRIRADLTRIEAAIESEGECDGPDAPLSAEVVHLRRAASSVDSRPTQQAVTELTGRVLEGRPQEALDWQPASDSLPDGMEILVCAPRDKEFPRCEQSQVTPAMRGSSELPAFPKVVDAPRSGHRKATSPIMASLTLHAVIIVLTATLTVATAVHEDRSLTLDVGGDLTDVVERPDVERLGQLDDDLLQNTISESPEFEVAGPIVDELTAIDFASEEGPASLGDAGSLGTLPTEFGTEMFGSGGLGADGTSAMSGLGHGNERRGGGGKRNSGPLGSAVFFGTQSQGDRFVFVVDNSSSMKGGRLEAAAAELLHTTNSLTPKQSFYVIFVSDQTYPMFFPQREPDLVPATAANKQRLAAWLPNAILASGNNRKLIEAMNMAAALQPHAVFLLWDGDMKYSEKVRLEVMTHLTRPNQWAFTIHTLGLGVTSLDAEQNLTTIAQAHGGTFRKVNLPMSRGR